MKKKKPLLIYFGFRKWFELKWDLLATFVNKKSIIILKGDFYLLSALYCWWVHLSHENKRILCHHFSSVLQIEKIPSVLSLFFNRRRHASFLSLFIKLKRDLVLSSGERYCFLPQLWDVKSKWLNQWEQVK